MKNWFKIFSTRTLAPLMMGVVVLLTGACKKDGNPFNLPDADPAQYERGANPGVIKILAIGNSFSEDAIESHLYELAKEKGIKVIIGNMYIGGASLDNHKANIERSLPAYEYRKISEDGSKKPYLKLTLDLALQDEDWDYVSFQQVSQNSGQLATVQSALPAVYNYVKSKVRNPNVKYIYHQTWAYAQSSTHTGFVNYNSNQMTMYNAIVDVSKKVKEIVPIDIIVPAGTAIQNGRTSAIEDNFTRDGYHLSIPLGRYTAACTWFETLFNQSTVGMTYRPEGMGTFEARVAQNAAHFAVLKPYEVTPMVDFQGEGGPLLAPVLIDFGKGAASSTWNQVNDFLAGTRIGLKDIQGKEYVGLSLSITERFNGENTGGATATTTPFNMPTLVSSRSYFGNTKRAFSGLLITQSVFVLSGLDKALTYNLCFFGSRAGVSDNRETKYIVAGTNQGQALLNTSANSTNIVCVERISPDANGKITVTVTAGENNNSADGFYYLNAARLTSN